MMDTFVHFYFGDQRYTTPELLEVLQKYAEFLNIPGISMEEGKAFDPVLIPVYVGEPYEHKQITLTQDQFYRCEATGGLWLNGEGITLDWNQFPADGSAVLEVLTLQHFDFFWHSYYLTDTLPDITDSLTPTPLSLLRYRENNGKLTVTGTRCYCEMLVIPAEYGGKPVDQVLLEPQTETQHLHTLVLKEGIRLVDAPWGLPELAQIQLPASGELLYPPHDIQKSYWFFQQKDGPVYFHNYYCGTVGAPASDVLTIRDGTIGVIDEADAKILWRQIHFPDTIAYLGVHCFDFTMEWPEKVTLPAGKGKLMQAFRDPPPTIGLKTPELSEENCWKLQEPLSLDDSFNSWALYSLGRNSPFVKTVILPGWEPTAPKLHYSAQEGWTAHFWYYCEEMDVAGYYAVFDLSSGLPLDIQALMPAVQLCRTGIWTEDYVPPLYLLSRDYLERCTDLIRKGKPSKEDLFHTHHWWQTCRPPKRLPETHEFLHDFLAYEHYLEETYDW